jgi:hypothetical protein
MKSETSKNLTAPFNRWAYAAFVLLAFYFVIFNHSLSDFVIQFGIALVFDPFNQNQKWNERPLWQRAWMIVHLAILGGAAGYLFSA